MNIRIALLIPLILVISTIISSLIIHYQLLSNSVRNIRTEAISDTHTNISRLQNIFYNYLTENTLDIQDARLNLSVSAMDKNIRHLFLTDSSHTILISNRYAYVSSKANNRSLYTLKSANRSITGDSSQLFFDPNANEILTGYFPVILKLENSDKKPQEQKGIIYIEYDISSKLRAARHDALIQTVIYSSLMLATSVAVAILLHFKVSRRLRKLIDTSIDLKNGNLDARVQLKGSDELAEIGSAFDKMAKQIRLDIEQRIVAKNELHEANENLEQRIQERTQALAEAQRIGNMGNWGYNVSSKQFNYSDQILSILGHTDSHTKLSYQDLFDNIHEDDLEEIINAEAQLQQNYQPYRIDYRIIWPDKTIHWLHKEVIIKRNSYNELFISGIIQNITDRKSIEENLLRTNEIAVESNNAKSEFLSRMSHELRTPMNAIMGFSQLLELGKLDNKQHEFLNEIKYASEHLLTLIDELLDLSRIEAGQLGIEIISCKLETILHQAIQLSHKPVSEKNITLTSYCDSSHYVNTDPTRLKQILVNLITNATKYNHPNGHIEISCEILSDTFIRVTIKDDGMGIKQEKLKDLFTPFERLGAEYTDIQGTGIGLALCKQIIKLMNGDIGVESIYNEGSIFWIDIPLSLNTPKADIEPAEAITQNPTTDTACKLLYIEDNRANLKVVNLFIDRFPNYQFFSAPDGKSGIEQARTILPEIILLDINLPEMNGHEVIKQLNSDPLTQHIPIIILSADAMELDITKAYDAGIKKYLTKPVNLKELMETLNELNPYIEATE